jgi:aminoglycoside phosphotransferase (APT) family kinase protein
VPEALPIPGDPAALTPEWLTGALSASVPGIEVAASEVLDQHTGTTGRVRLGLRYAAGPAGPDSVFVKLAPFDEWQRSMVAATDMGRREARFYAGPAVDAPMRIPEAFHAAAGAAPTEYVMVLEDLAAAGCTFVTNPASHAEEHGRELVEALATLHARFWDDPRFDDELSWVQPAMRGEFGAQLVDSARRQFAADLPPVFAELCELYVQHHEAIALLWDEGEQTLVHGDCHTGNQFVARDGDALGAVGLYDWAVLSRSPGIRDVAYYLGASCPAEQRAAHQEEWIRAYRDVLVGAGVDAPSFDDLWLRYRRAVLYSWVAAATTASMGSKWQPIEVGMQGMTRATQACADLDTLDALRAAL